MIVLCEKCGLKYKVDPSKIHGDSARLTCKGCAHVITINKPDVTVAPSALDSADGSHLPPPRNQPVSDGAPLDYPPQNKRIGWGLTGEVVIMLLLVSFLPGIVYFVLSSYQTSQNVYDETGRTGQQTVDYLTQQVNEWVAQNVRLLTLTAGLPEMSSMDRASQELLMKDVQRQYPWIYLIHVVDLNGMDVARSDDGPLTDYGSRKYVKDIQEGKEISFENVIGLTSKKPGLMIVTPIKKDGQVAGGLVFAISFEQLTRIVIDWRHGQMGSVFIADKEGKIIVHKNEQFIKEQKNFSDYALVMAAQKKNTGLVAFKDSTNEETIGFARSTELGWTVGLEINKKEAYAALKKSQTGSIILFGATVFGTIISAFFASRAIVAPIRRLTEAADRISVGELSVQIVRTSQDEIGDLADAITRMQDSIRLSIERIRRKTNG